MTLPLALSIATTCVVTTDNTKKKKRKKQTTKIAGSENAPIKIVLNTSKKIIKGKNNFNRLRGEFVVF